MVELKLDVNKQKMRVFKDVYSEDDCERKVMLNKEKAFSVFSKVASLFEKRTRIDITHKEKKYYPIWNVKAQSFTEYLRNNNYSFPVEPQVRTVKISGHVFEVSKEAPVCKITGEDYCVEQYAKDEVTDATGAGVKEKKLLPYLKFESRPISQTEELMGRRTVVIPATIRAAFIVRDLFKELIKPVHADKVLTEKIEVTEICLYFRPAYAFELTKQPSGKTAVLEVDALTGEMRSGSVFKKELKEVVSEDLLFDLGAEIVSNVIPGAGAVAAIGKKVHEMRKHKTAVKQMRSSQNAMATRSKKSPIRLH